MIGVANRMKRKIVRRRSQYNFETSLATAFVDRTRDNNNNGSASLQPKRQNQEVSSPDKKQDRKF